MASVSLRRVGPEIGDNRSGVYPRNPERRHQRTNLLEPTYLPNRHGGMVPVRRLLDEPGRDDEHDHRNAASTRGGDDLRQQRRLQVEGAGRVVRSRRITPQHGVRRRPQDVEIAEPRLSDQSRQPPAQRYSRRIVLDESAVLDTETAIRDVVAEIVHRKRLHDDRIDSLSGQHPPEHLQLLRRTEAAMPGVERARPDPLAPQRPLRCAGKRLIVADAAPFGERVADEEHATVERLAAAHPEAGVIIGERSVLFAGESAGPIFDFLGGCAPLHVKNDGAL